MFKFIYTALCLTIVLLQGCARLDSNLFNPNEHKITAYNFGNYTGDVDFKLDDTYKIPEEKITLVTLGSKTTNETTATKIYGVYVGDKNRIGLDTVIVYCHGNKDHMDFYWPRVQLLANTKSKNHYGVLMIDYRGYGLSEGKPSEEALYADVNAGLQWLKDNGLTGNRLVMYGFSMGTIPATRATAEPLILTPAKLMLEAPMASAEAMVQDATALALPASFFTDLQANNVAMIAKVQQPFFWIHGAEDKFLPLNSQGQLVYNAYKGVYKEAHVVPVAGHSNVPPVMGYSNYLGAVAAFISH